MKYSIFPTDCKIAKLKPLFKKGSKTAPKNYRPISLLPLILKIIEKLIHDFSLFMLILKFFLMKLRSGTGINQVLGDFFPPIHVCLT